MSEAHEPFWHLDEALGELDLQERPGGPDHYTVRLKARTTALRLSIRTRRNDLLSDVKIHGKLKPAGD